MSLFNLSCEFATTSLSGCEITNAEMTHFRRHWLFVNIPFTKEDKILIKNLFELKSPRKCRNCGGFGVKGHSRSAAI